MASRACYLLLEDGDDLLLESGDRLTDEGAGGWLLTEDDNYLLLESGDKIILELGTPCMTATSTAVVTVFRRMHVGKRRMGMHSRGIRVQSPT